MVSIAALHLIGTAGTFSRLDSHVGGKIEDLGGERDPRGKLHHSVVFHVQQLDIGRIWECFGQYVLREVLLHLHDADWWSVINNVTRYSVSKSEGLIFNNLIEPHQLCAACPFVFVFQ